MTLSCKPRSYPPTFLVLNGRSLGTALIKRSAWGFPSALGLLRPSINMQGIQRRTDTEPCQLIRSVAFMTRIDSRSCYSDRVNLGSSIFVNKMIQNIEAWAGGL